MADPSAARLVYITAPDDETADRIAATLVEERLAACVNVIPGMRSVYRWEGKIARDEETVLIAKTTRALAPALAARARELHPYDEPAIVALDVDPAGSSAPFLAWIAKETARS